MKYYIVIGVLFSILLLYWACTGGADSSKSEENGSSEKITNSTDKNNKMRKQNIKWQWNEEHAGSEVKINDIQYSYLYNEDDDVGEIIKEHSSEEKEVIWKRSEASISTASLLMGDEKYLYVGIYSRTATGLQILALDTASKKVVWESSIQGLGSVAHSRYSNKVQLGLIEDDLVIFGWESNGKYIEVLNSKNGELISNKKMD